MKKLLSKVSKKVKYTIGGIILLALVIADALCSQSVRENGQKHQDTETNTEVTVIEPEPSFDTYEKLKQDYQEDTVDMEKEIANQSDRTYTDDTASVDENGTVAEEKIRVIDESDETMDDQTSGTEKEYDVNKEPQGKIELQKPKKEEGKDVKDTTKPGGKQGVGTWG